MRKHNIDNYHCCYSFERTFNVHAIFSRVEKELAFVALLRLYGPHEGAVLSDWLEKELQKWLGEAMKCLGVQLQTRLPRKGRLHSA